MTAYASHNQDGVTLLLRLQPRAKREGLVGQHNGRLKVAVKAAPVDGAANEALTRLLADIFGLPKSAVVLLAGNTSKEKRVLLKHIELKQVLESIANILVASTK
jgi:uncharacterized protein (TIGR00251 family)